MQLKTSRSALIAIIITIVIFSSLLSEATLYLKDSIPCDASESTDYSAASLYQQNPTISTIIGGTGAWGTSSTQTQKAYETGLFYPSFSGIDSSGGCLGTYNSASSENGNGRYLSRLISEVPTNGTFFLSVLIQMEDLSSAGGWTIGEEQCGAGFRKSGGSTQFASKMQQMVSFLALRNHLPV